MFKFYLFYFWSLLEIISKRDKDGYLFRTNFEFYLINFNAHRKITSNIWFYFCEVVACFALTQMLGRFPPPQISLMWSIIISVSFALVSLIMGREMIMMTECLRLKTSQRLFWVSWCVPRCPSRNQPLRSNRTNRPPKADPDPRPELRVPRRKARFGRKTSSGDFALFEFWRQTCKSSVEIVSCLFAYEIV